jgi:Domain of unknown function (DUF4123)
MRPFSADTTLVMSNNLDALLLDLNRIVRDPEWRVFVLVDGARFDNVSVALTAAGIAHRSLYRNVGDTELVRAGPWLVDPYHLPGAQENEWGAGQPESGSETGEADIAKDTRAALKEPLADAAYPDAGKVADPVAQLEAVLKVTGETSAAVFWIGNASLSEPALWRHLRTLNMVLIPKEYDAPDSAAPAPGEETHEAMIFRHGDGNVLAEVLPVLEAAQFSRIFGPATALMFLAPDHPRASGSAILRSVLPDDAPPARAGLLRLSMEQMEGIEAVRYQRLHKRTIDYLLRVGGERLEGRTGVQLQNDADTWLKSGMAYGVKSECALWQWSYLQLYTRGRLTEAPGLDAYMRRWPGPADEKVDFLMSASITRLKELA